jgi:hypothetical protein
MTADDPFEPIGAVAARVVDTARAAMRDDSSPTGQSCRWVFSGSAPVSRWPFGSPATSARRSVASAAANA